MRIALVLLRVGWLALACFMLVHTKSLAVALLWCAIAAGNVLVIRWLIRRVPKS